MENEQKKPQLLIVDNAEGDRKYGIEHGYYPELITPIRSGSLAVITQDEIPKYQLSTPPMGKGMDFYVSNPSAQTFISMWEPDILRILVGDKSFAVKEALVRMGAKDIVLTTDAKDADTMKININNQADFTLANADVTVDYDNSSSINLKSVIESHDSNRRPKSPDKVEAFMLSHGLITDASLMLLLDRLKEDKVLHGTEIYEITFLSEIQNALNIAANINYKLFNDKLDFSKKHNHVKTITKAIRINFE